MLGLVYADGNLCISILHEPGEDQYGYEDAGERWLPVHTVESIVRIIIYVAQKSYIDILPQLVSVISLLSSDRPNLDSPANVDAAKEVRENWEGTLHLPLFMNQTAYDS